MKISEMNVKKILQDNLVGKQNSKVCMKHFEEHVLWKYDIFPCSNVDRDIIVSETIRFNELQLLRFRLLCIPQFH